MPLTGVRVLDLSRLLPGPYATRQLAELGAEVVKVEDPNGGDYARWYPPLVGDPPAGALFRELNAGKKSVALDLKSEAGAAALRKLAEKSDVLVDTFRPGVLARLGLDPKDLMAANPRLVYCAITGFGLNGPDALRAGHDLGYLARTGGLDLCGTEDQVTPPGVQIADVGGAMTAVSGILAALLKRERTGKGSVVDVSLVEAGAAFTAASIGLTHADAPVRRGHEMLDGSRPCYGVYRTKDDRWLAVGALEPKFWSAFCTAVGLEDLMASGLDAGEPGKKARERIQAKLLERTQQEWTAVFREVEACVEPVLTLAEADEDPHALARDVRTNVGTARSPIRIAEALDVEAPKVALTEAPALGADTEEVLAEVGIEI